MIDFFKDVSIYYYGHLFSGLFVIFSFVTLWLDLKAKKLRNKSIETNYPENIEYSSKALKLMNVSIGLGGVRCLFLIIAIIFYAQEKV